MNLWNIFDIFSRLAFHAGPLDQWQCNSRPQIIFRNSVPLSVFMSRKQILTHLPSSYSSPPVKFSRKALPNGSVSMDLTHYLVNPSLPKEYPGPDLLIIHRTKRLDVLDRQQSVNSVTIDSRATLLS